MVEKYAKKRAALEAIFKRDRSDDGATRRRGRAPGLPRDSARRDCVTAAQLTGRRVVFSVNLVCAVTRSANSPSTANPGVLSRPAGIRDTDMAMSDRSAIC